MRRLLWIGCFTYLLIGLTHIILGSILTEILEYYNRSYTDGGILIATQSVGFLTGVIGSSYLSRYLGRRKTLVLASLSIAFSQLAFMSLVPWDYWIVIAIFAGLGFGIIEPLVGSLIIDSIKDKPAVSFSKLEVFFGIGSLIMPIISGWLATTDLWRYSFLVLGLYAFVIAFIWMKVSFGTLDELMGKTKVGTAKKYGVSSLNKGKSRLLLYSFILFFLIYVGAEISIMNFLPSIIISKLNTDPFAATLSVTLFWAAMVVGRLFAGHLAEWFNYVRYLIICCVGMIIFVASLGFITNIWLGYALVVLIGLMMAGIFGIALVYANQLLPGNTEKNTSILIASGGIGGILLPLLTGGLMDHYSTVAVALVLAGLTGLMLIIILISNSRNLQE